MALLPAAPKAGSWTWEEIRPDAKKEFSPPAAFTWRMKVMSQRSPVQEWFRVEFDESGVRMDVRPPGLAPWKASFAWPDVQRICFKAEDVSVSDGIYVFTRLRPESFVIPTEAQGGPELWSEIIRRGLFAAELAIKAATEVGTVSCWPPDPKG